jgi:hypothetical protein
VAPVVAVEAPKQQSGLSRGPSSALTAMIGSEEPAQNFAVAAAKPDQNRIAALAPLLTVDTRSPKAKDPEYCAIRCRRFPLVAPLPSSSDQSYWEPARAKSPLSARLDH